MEKVDRRIEEIAQALVNLFPKFSIAEQRIELTLYRLLAGGKPVGRDDIANALQIESDAVSNYLNPITWVQYNDSGQITAFRGLTLEPTSHRLVVDHKTLYTWCALDTLFIPQLLGKTTLVESVCPVTGNKVRLTVEASAVTQLDPPDAVISLVTPDAAKTQENVIGHFCCFVHFFSSAAVGAQWLSKNQGKFVISVADAYDVGRKINEVQYTDTLTISQKD